MEHGQRCLYEILGIERSSTPDEIRAAYRKLALKHHPDKLVQSGVPQEEATARFQEILRAYEVLSDPRERSWYDSHRSQILYSSAPSPANNSDFDLNLWPYFSTSVYSGYGETGKGFFKVYGDLFNKLFQQEVAFAHAMEGPRVTEAPLMGNLGSAYSQVSAFYNYWLGFCTVKDFSWVDEYRASLGPNRKSRRLMEEENKKLRKKARREYNETVRQLAEFVKKRDKRVLERQIEKKREQAEKEAMSQLRRKQLESERLEKARQYEEPEWTKIAEEEEEEEEEGYGIRGGGDDGWYGRKIKDEPDGGLQAANQELYCVVCSKKFKSDKQWKNHEQSKKHRERVLELRDSFVEEDTLADGILKGVDDELASGARADDLGIGEALESSVRADALGSDEDLDFKAHTDEPRAEAETYSRARSDDHRIDDELYSRAGGDNLRIDEDLDVRAQVDSICNSIGDMLDLKEDGIDAETASVTDASALNKTEYHEGVNSDIEHYDDVDDVSDKSSYHTIAEDEKTELENNAEAHFNDGKEERENGHMDDEVSLLEAMLKTHRTKQGADNAYKPDIALTETDDSGGNYRANARQAGFKNQRNRKQQGFALRSSDLIQSVMDNGAEIDAGTSSRASQRQGSKKTEKQKRKQAAVPAEHSVMGVLDLVKLRPEGNVGIEQGRTGFSSHIKGEADTIEGDKEKERLQEPAKQSADRKSATSSSSMKDMSGKGKKHAKAKKGKGIPKLAGHTCETCGEDFDSRNLLFTHLSGTGHATLKSR